MALPNFLKFLELSNDNSLKLLNSENDKTKRFLSFIGVLNLNKKNAEEKTLLHQTIEKGNDKAATYLIDKGADLNLQDSQGNTALHIAAQYNQTAVAKYLVDKGVKLDVKNNDGKIPWDMTDKSPTNIAETLYEEIDLNESGDTKTKKEHKAEPNKKPKAISPVIEAKTQDNKTPSNWQVIAPTSHQHSETTSVKASAYRATERQNTQPESIVITKPTIPETTYRNPKAAEIGKMMRKGASKETPVAPQAVVNTVTQKTSNAPKSSTSMTKVTIKEVTRSGPGQGNSR